MMDEQAERANKLERIKKRLIEMGLVIDSPAYEKPVQNESALPSPVCSTAGCRLKHYKLGLCKKHYKSSRSTKSAKSESNDKNLEA